MKGVMRFGKKGKLSPLKFWRELVLLLIGLLLPPTLSRLHNIFHVFVLRRYVLDPSHILSYGPLQVKENLSYEEVPIQIVDHKEQVLRNKTIHLVKVLWRNHSIEEDS